jgi:hypothetical protein
LNSKKGAEGTVIGAGHAQLGKGLLTRFRVACVRVVWSMFGTGGGDALGRLRERAQPQSYSATVLLLWLSYEQLGFDDQTVWKP